MDSKMCAFCEHTFSDFGKGLFYQNPGVTYPPDPRNFDPREPKGAKEKRKIFYPTLVYVGKGESYLNRKPISFHIRV